MSDSFREVAVQAAVSAGTLLRSHAGAVRSITYKSGPTNIVTEMDRRAEALIVDAIRARFPAHSILAEECGLVAGTASHRWIVDPLDGTTNYAHGLPVYGVSIALEVAGRVALGVVCDPSREECFVAERGRGAVLNGAPIRVSGTSSLDESLLSTGYPYDVREKTSNNLAEHNALISSAGPYASWAPPSSPWPTSRPGAWTPSGKAGSAPGMWRRARSWWRRPAGP